MSAAGPLLSEYRKKNHLSQLDLSLLADVSSRHISFIETGRTQPSRTMLLRLADVLDLPHKDSNLLLHSGGFAATYTELDIESEEMAPVRAALNLILENHNPYPAVVMDGNWNMLMANRSQQQFLS
jgi:transcriptional regulator with XRE-family HTH domain